MTASFKDQTLDSAANYLAHRKVGLQRGLVSSLDKQAFDLSSTLTSIGDAYKSQSPVVQKGIIGAGVGGALGLGSSMFSRPGRGNAVRDTLTGALAGGLAGGGYGLVQDRKNLANKAVPGGLDNSTQDQLEELYDTQEKAQPSLVHRTGSAMADHPILSALGLAGGADVATGSALASQGKNISPTAWQNVTRKLEQQIAASGGDPGKSSIFTQIENVKGKAAANKFRKNPLAYIQTLKPAQQEELMKSLSYIDDVTTPMTGLQYLLQQGKQRAANPPSKSKANRLDGILAKTRPVLDKLPTSLPKSRSLRYGIPAGLISLWLASKGYANTENARDQLEVIKQQIAGDGK
jgi:hypothetical protein